MRHALTYTLALAILSLAGCRKEEKRAAAPQAPPPVRVKTLRVEPQTFAATVVVTGTLRSRSTVDVKAEITGRVVRFPKEEGQSVTAGEALVWVDDEQYRLSVRQAETAVGVVQAALERTRVQEAHAKLELERARNLLRSGGITDRDLKTAEVADKDTVAQVALAAAQVDQAQAALAVARKKLGDTVIKAPVAGEIQKKWTNPGAFVEPPTAVFTLVDNTRLELESSVPAAEAGPVRAGQRVEFRVSSFPQQRFEGRVVEILPAMDAESRSAKLRVRIVNPGGRLKSGMFAEGEVQTGATSSAIVIPSEAIYRDDAAAKSSYVFAVENGKAVRRPVRIGRERNGTLEILEGLPAGALIVAEPSIELADGVAVEVAGAGK
ncbi:MAG: efflux RND transporter periplasmic adaptor subunit [Acidobacteria bacterium]|nr:efflux RND transporter periplasmic adaptor subunit [Acidobacteriota bacterium]